MYDDVLIIIPARVASSRLPRKMLAELNGNPLIVWTYKSAISANIGQVIVACDGQEIKNAIENAGGVAVITDPELPSGTDRVFAAWKSYDLTKKYKYLINLQGDLPFINPEFISKTVEFLKNSNYDIATPAAAIYDNAYNIDSVVKIAVTFTSECEGQALYFSRSPIPFSGPYYHHVGLYCFKTEALKKFVSLPQSRLEKIEKLEQLRAIENGMTIGVELFSDLKPPLSIDTAEDLEKARKYVANMRM